MPGNLRSLTSRRGNIGNSKVLNEETHDDLLQQTGMNTTKYAVAVSLFSLAYALFEVSAAPGYLPLNIC